MSKALPAQPSQRVAAFLDRVSSHRGRIAFVIDATGSREHAWDAATGLQAEMFTEAAKLGGLEMQVTYFGGVDTVRSSSWTGDARELQTFMARVRCEGGPTKYARAFMHVRSEHRKQALNAVVVVGDMLEEVPADIYDSIAGLGAPLFMFQEGVDPIARPVFEEMARLTKGAYYTFDAGSIAQLRELLRAVAAFAVGGLTALADQRTDAARKLLGQMKK
jgi:hypothetical protein